MSLTAAASLTQEQVTWVSHLAGQAEPHRRSAQQEVTTRPVTEQQAVVEALLERGRREQESEPLVESLLYIAKATADLRRRIAEGLWDMRGNLTPGSVMDIADSDSEELHDLAARLADATDVAPMVKEAAKLEREGR